MANYLDNIDVIDANGTSTNVEILDKNTLALAQRIDNDLTAFKDVTNTNIGEIQTKLSHLVVNVLDYGLVNDGVTNNVNAFTELLQTKPNYAYYFPKGKYVFTGGRFSGNVNIIGVGDATLIDFVYEDLNFPVTNKETAYDPDQAYFKVDNVKFTNTSTYYALDIHVQSQGSVVNVFNIQNCTFYGRRGVRIRNCGNSHISNCNFIKLEYAFKSESSTNIYVDDCNFFACVFGVHIATALDDTAGRYGGESVYLNKCLIIDGVTGIYADRHNYLVVTDCTIDWMNCCIFLIGSQFARIVNTYTGCENDDKSAMSYYIAPPNYGCLFASIKGSANIVSSVECINDEFSMYRGTHLPVVLQGYSAEASILYGIENSEFVNCLFKGHSNDVDVTALFYASRANNLRLTDNEFWCAYNNHLQYPYNYNDCIRVTNNHNIFADCFTSGGVAILPEKIDNRMNNNYDYECYKATLTVAGSTPTLSQNIEFQNAYSSAPVINVMIETTVPDVIATISNTSGTGFTATIAKADGTNLTAGNYILHIIVMHSSI